MRMMRLALAGVLLMLPVGCGGSGTEGKDPARPERKVELVVGVAASLREPLEEAIADFRQHFPRIGITPTVGSSGVLTEQARAGAPMDIILLADPKRMAQLGAEGIVDTATIHSLAGNSLVGVVPASSDVYLRDAGELVDPRLARIAVGNPEMVPLGAHTRAALESVGAWDLVHDRTVLTENAGQTIDLARRGEVDLAFVYSTDAIAAGDTVRVVLTFPIEERLYEVALLKAGQSPNRFPASAKAFYQTLAGEEFRAILEKRGFRVD